MWRYAMWRTVLVVTSLLLLPACAPTWVKPGASPQDLARDEYQCIQETTVPPQPPQTVIVQSPYGYPQTVYQQPGWDGFTIARSMRSRNAYKACMKARGYVEGTSANERPTITKHNADEFDPLAAEVESYKAMRRKLNEDIEELRSSPAFQSLSKKIQRAEAVNLLENAQDAEKWGPVLTNLVLSDEERAAMDATRVIGDRHEGLERWRKDLLRRLRADPASTEKSQGK